MLNASIYIIVPSVHIVTYKISTAYPEDLQEVVQEVDALPELYRCSFFRCR